MIFADANANWNGNHLRPAPRLSLLEVLAALAIFLISLIALGQLISITGEQRSGGPAIEPGLPAQPVQVGRSCLGRRFALFSERRF